MITLLDDEFSQLNALLEELKPDKIFILTDTNTHDFCLPILLGNLTTQIPFEILEIDCGEDMKTLDTSIQLWEILSEYEANRTSIMINLGGGVISDIGGFVASTFKRGIRFINIPTTLLAMCDASIGGKTGVNHQFLKNIIGTFSQPESIFIYPQFLKTLPFKELLSGYAEMLKHGLIADETHWNKLTAIHQLSIEAITPHIMDSIHIKETIINQDFKEKNIRKNLNFGHTVGHALESFCLKEEIHITHGEAVAVGIICESHLAHQRNFISTHQLEKISCHIRKFFPRINFSADNISILVTLMKHDKKNNQDGINFSLIKGIGTCVYNQTISEQDIIECLKYYLQISTGLQ